jgi:Carboxypeptidase regulatory-like domain/TonB dependent receptor/TonB-dependent Receptor Plug Domain
MILDRRFLSARSVAVDVALSFLVLLCAVSAPAQSSRIGASLRGAATDSSGGVLPNAKVTLRNTLTNQIRTVTTDEQGLFRAEQLPVGTYEVRVEQPGLAPYQHAAVQLNLGQTVYLDIVLAPASTSASVTVNAEPSVMDTSQTSVVSSIDQERIEELPVRNRNYLDFVLLSPGVSSSPAASSAAGATPLAGSGFTFGGLRTRSNNISIDGLDNNDEYSGSSRTELSPEIVQEFQVVNNGLSAESGGASGGSINVITRSGTNIIHGDAFLFAQDGALNAREPFEADPGKPSFRRFRAGAALGGPIVKDHTFYYAAAEQEHNRGQAGSDIDPAVVSTINTFLASGAFPGLTTRHLAPGFFPIARTETEAAGKLDHQLTKNTALMLRYVFTNNKESGDAFNNSGLIDASARGSSFTSDNALSASLTSVLGSQAVSDFRFQAATRNAVLRTNQPIGAGVDIAGLATFGRPYGGNSARRENHYQAGYTYTRTVGKHLWRVGGTVNRVQLHANLLDGFGGVYLFNSLTDFLAGAPDQFRQTFGNPNVDFPVTSFGGFVQDHWSLTRRLTIDLGVRYDLERLPAAFNQDTNNISPRIGAAWSPSAKCVFRAGYGIFFDRFVLANLARAIEKNGSQAFEQVADGNASASLFAAAAGGALSAPTPAIAPSIFRPDPRMATPYSQQASASAEYLLANNLTLRADYLFVHGLKLPRTININLLPPVVLTPANGAKLGLPNPTPQQIGREVFTPARAMPQFDDIYQLQNSAASTYNGGSLTLSRRMDQELEFSASYTLSKTFDTASDYDEQPQNPFNLRAESAISRQHQQQRFVFNALWDLPIGDEDEKGGKAEETTGWLTQTFSHIEVAPILTLESGRPVNPLTGLDSNRSHAFPISARPLALGRNSLNTPALFALDLRVLKYFPFGGAKRLDLVAEFFNLFNRANVSEINPVFGSSLTPISGFTQPIAGAGARQIQFSLDFEF